jgi:hypothetical protein
MRRSRTRGEAGGGSVEGAEKPVTARYWLAKLVRVQKRITRSSDILWAAFRVLNYCTFGNSFFGISLIRQGLGLLQTRHGIWALRGI